MQDTVRDRDSAIPGFSKIPGIGEFFKTRANDSEKRELLQVS